MKKKLVKGWKWKRLGEIFIFQNKTGRKAGEGLEQGGYKFFTSSSKQTKFINKFDFDGEYLIFATGGQAGIHYCKGKFSSSNDCFIVKVNDEVLGMYVYYYLFSKIYLLERGFMGAGLKHISKKYIQKIEINYPINKNTQKQIVSILEKAERLKERRKEASEETNKIIQNIFYNLFLREKNKWENGKLFSFIEDFIVPQRDKPKVFDGNIPWCRIEDFNGIYLSESKSKKFVSEETVRKMHLRVYPINTVLVSCSADLGKCAIVKKPLVTNQTFIGLVPSKKINPLFLYYYMITKARKLNKMATGATIKYLSKKNFQELNVNIPPLNLQNKFAEYVEKIEKIKQHQLKSEQEINKLFDALMQKAFNGGLI
ncbi:MAG: restriction endonuclease subunit S [Nanoarchaeota archaeon]|nr:restriction endonuclease subunit S [Nanoarchaeota archaeon]